MEFRDLRADEVECRVVHIVENRGLFLVPYKDARCDMNILDETVGPMNWKREHCRENANCVVSIWDDKKEQWISKEDTGTESNTEAQKGLASDSFKRACVNWGIGRELYTAPIIWVKASDCEIKRNDKGKLECKTVFNVEQFEVKNKKITLIEISANGKRVFIWGSEKPAPAPAEPFKRNEELLTLDQRDEILKLCEITGTDLKKIKDRYKVATIDALTKAQASKAIEILTGMVEKQEAENADQG